jgi:hypothetical protein
MVPRGDFARVIAEFWDDGPSSETPPGHWFAIANSVADHPLLEKRLGGLGPVLDDLEWDVKVYFALGGALHDAAVAAWGIKGWYDFVRPVSAIRYLGGLGQSSDPLHPSYHPGGITLRPGLIEIITAASTAPGERHAHLRGNEGRIAVRSWRGPAFVIDPASDEAGAGWILAEKWWPYQRPSFVTPPFAGYVAGHSAYSRAAAVVLARLTGSEYFPGGLGEFRCPRDQYLTFEDGPSIDVTLQWAKYTDASDQSSLSGIWGGLYGPADDLPGRRIGQAIGEDAVALAATYFDGLALDPFRRGDANGDGGVDVADASFHLNWLFLGGSTPPCLAALNANGDAQVDISDAAYLLIHLFLAGPPPAAPYPDCGAGAAAADPVLGCATPSGGCR